MIVHFVVEAAPRVLHMTTPASPKVLRFSTPAPGKVMRLDTPTGVTTITTNGTSQVLHFQTPASTRVISISSGLSRIMQLGIQGPTGAQGPIGPTGGTGAVGPQGPPGFTIEHTQLIAASVWVITHNQAAFPAVTLEVAGRLVEANAVYTSANTVTVTFGRPYAGKAYLNF